MGKKHKTDSHILTTKEEIKHASNLLERHLINRDRNSIKQLLQDKWNQSKLHLTTYDRYCDLLRQIKKQSEVIKSLNIKADDIEEQRIKIRKKERLMTQFQELLDKSANSYERTYAIFKNKSLKQKYGHLLKQNKDENQEQKVDTVAQQLCEQQERALTKIKKLYRRYRVSNMYKANVCAKIKSCYIDQLIKKGFLRQKNTILSLVC